jgi:hypothetical protein
VVMVAERIRVRAGRAVPGLVVARQLLGSVL